MVSKSSRTRKSKEKPTSGSSSSCEPKLKPLSHPHYLVVDSTLPSHVFHDRSLFTTYVPSRKRHRTVYGTDIIIEGTGDVHIHVIVSGKSILFRFRDSWHVPSSSRHFLSCSSVISLGHQVMLAGRSPRMIYSHKRRLIVPDLPKYIPFTRVDGLIVLTFDIPAQGSFSPEPEPILTTTRSPAAQTALSLSASTFFPFAGLASNQKFLPNSRQVAFPGSHSLTTNRPSQATGALGVVLHGGVDAQSELEVNTAAMTLTASSLDFSNLELEHGHGTFALRASDSLRRNPSLPSPSTNFSTLKFSCSLKDQVVASGLMSHGGEDVHMTMPVPVDVENGTCRLGRQVGDVALAVYGGAEDGGAVLSVGISDSVQWADYGVLDALNLTLDSVTPDSEARWSIALRVPTRYHPYYSPYTPLTLTSVLNIDTTCFLFPYNNSSSFFHLFTPFPALTLFESSFSPSVQQIHVKFSPLISCFSTSFPFLVDFSLPLSLFPPTFDFAHPIIPSHFNSEFSKALTALAYQPFSGLTVPNLPIQLHFLPSQFPFYDFQCCTFVSLSSRSLLCFSILFVPIPTVPIFWYHPPLSSGFPHNRRLVLFFSMFRNGDNYIHNHGYIMTHTRCTTLSHTLLSRRPSIPTWTLISFHASFYFIFIFRFLFYFIFVF